MLDYVGRYTHRVAITNNRLLAIDNGNVRFRWKDYRNESTQKTMTLAADEFIRRFLLHALPLGLQRIRYYGLFGNRHRREKLAQCRRLLNQVPDPSPSAALATRADYRDLPISESPFPLLLSDSRLRDCNPYYKWDHVVVRHRHRESPAYSR